VKMINQLNRLISPSKTLLLDVPDFYLSIMEILITSVGFNWLILK